VIVVAVVEIFAVFVFVRDVLVLVHVRVRT